jgi:hypothetical protein
MTIGTALVLIFCMPLGWIGLLCLAVAVVALREVIQWHRMSSPD